MPPGGAFSPKRSWLHPRTTPQMAPDRPTSPSLNSKGSSSFSDVRNFCQRFAEIPCASDLREEGRGVKDRHDGHEKAALGLEQVAGPHGC